MKTILSVSACWVLFVFIRVEAVNGDLQSVLARLSVLEEKQVFSEKRIAALETENKLSQKRIADLEKYKALSNRRVAALERNNALCNRRNYAFAKQISIETEKKRPDKITTKTGYYKSLSDREVVTLEKDKILSDRKLSTHANNYAVSPNPSGKEDRHTAAVEITNRSSAVLQSEHRRFVAEGIVAFSATKSTTQTHLGLNQHIIFETVLTNEGGGYHPKIGVFIAPQSGLYVLSSTLTSGLNGGFNADIVHNGNVVGSIFGHGDNGHYDQSSQTVVMRLNVGDEVAVQNTLPNDSVYGNQFSSFSGFFIVATITGHTLMTTIVKVLNKSTLVYTRMLVRNI